MDKELQHSMERINVGYQDLIHQWSQDQLKLIYGDTMPTAEQMEQDDVIIQHNGCHVIKRSDYRLLKNQEEVGDTFLVWRYRQVSAKKDLQS